MKLLYVTPSIPYPPLTGNRMIALNHIRMLGRRHEVDLISFGESEELGDLRRYCRDIVLVEQPAKWRSWMNMVNNLPERIPFGVARLRSAEMGRTVERSLRRVAYDAVIFQLSEMAAYRPDWFSGAAIWSLEDPPSLKYMRLLPYYPWYSRTIVKERIHRWRKFEKQQSRRFDCILFVNEEDAKDYRAAVPEARVDWVPSAIEAHTFQPPRGIRRREGMIVITGNMFHKPNIDAVDYFCSDIFPRVCQQVEAAHLWIVGSHPAAAVRKWAVHPRITVTGYVANMQEYLWQARVSVCPVRLRIGTQTKVLEALASGTPVVTSPAGNHGIAGVSGEHLFVADDPEEFSDRIVSLLKGYRWHEFSETGRRFVEQNFTWEKSTASLERILESLIGSRAPGAVA
jgi:glycosyltransferase involved in cell wall biosynthesis